MTCRELVEFLDDYLAGDLPAGSRAAFEAHLVDCPDCVVYVRTYRDAVRVGKAAFSAGDEQVPGDVPDDLLRAIRAATAVARRPKA